MRTRDLFVLGAALFLGGCASNDGAPAADSSFAQAPLVTVTSDRGALRIAAWTAPDQPPTRGMLTVRLLVTDAASGAPIDGLAIAMSPDMPSMGHGTPVDPTITASGGGVYVATDVDLFMAGRWDLPMTITGATTDHAVVSLDVR
jgi:hypothetical protein